MPGSRIAKVFVVPGKYTSSVRGEIQFKKKSFGQNAASILVDKIMIRNLATGEVMSVCQKNYELKDKELLNVMLIKTDCNA